MTADPGDPHIWYDAALGVSKGGWVLCNPVAFSGRRSKRAEDPPYWIWVRLARAADLRFVIVEVRLTHARQRLTADHLRAVPLGRIETICNTPPVENWISASIGDQEYEMRRIPNIEESPYGGAGTYRPPRKLERVKNWRGRYPDEFYQGLAIEYGRLALTNPSPAGLIAKANDVPVSTVYRWLKEARRRGIMPPARKGPAPGAYPAYQDDDLGEPLEIIEAPEPTRMTTSLTADDAGPDIGEPVEIVEIPEREETE